MDKRELLEVFPEIDLIESEELKDMVYRAYKLGSDLGGWEKKGGFANCPVATEGIMRDGCTVTGVKHMRTVAETTYRVVNYLKPWLEKFDYQVDTDFCVCGAVLHDVGKLIEFDRREDNTPCFSRVGRMFCHTSAGAYLVKKAGGSDEMVHMVLTHSYAEAPEGSAAYESPENMIVKGADGACFESILVAWAQPSKQLKI